VAGVVKEIMNLRLPKKYGEYLGCLRKYWLHKEDSATWIQLLSEAVCGEEKCGDINKRLSAELSFSAFIVIRSKSEFRI
jgi:hypothetical protein